MDPYQNPKDSTQEEYDEWLAEQDEDEDSWDREPTYCDACASECDSMILMNGLCPMCFECRGGLNPADENPHGPWS